MLNTCLSLGPSFLASSDLPKVIIVQGATFKQPVRWETGEFASIRIAAIENTVPVRITTDGPHGIPPGWNVAVVGVRGPTILNDKANPPRNFRRATVINPTTIEFNGFSAAGLAAYVPNSGYLQWRVPHDLSGYSASMDIRDAVTNDLIVNLNTSNTEGGIIDIDEDEMTINLKIEDELTAGFDPNRLAIFNIKMISPQGDVAAILPGVAELRPAITTTV